MTIKNTVSTTELKSNFSQEFQGEDILLVTLTNGRKSAIELPALALDESYPSQKALQDDWENQFNNINAESEEIIPVLGKNGFYSNYFPKLLKTNNIDIPVENIYYIDKMNGIVNSTKQMANYDAGTYENDKGKSISYINNLSELIERNPDKRKVFSQSEWWSFITGLTGNSLAKVITRAIKEDKQVHLVITSTTAKVIGQELKALTNLFDVEELQRHLRIFCTDISSQIPDEIQGVDIYNDKDLLDATVLGSTRDFNKRLWFAFMHTVEEISDNPDLDAETFYNWQSEIYDDYEKTYILEKEALFWDNNSTSNPSNKVKRVVLPIDEAYVEIAKVWNGTNELGTKTFGNPVRISKVLHALGFRIGINIIAKAVSMYGKPRKGVEYTVDTLPEPKLEELEKPKTEKPKVKAKNSGSAIPARPSSKKAQKKANKKHKTAA